MRKILILLLLMVSSHTYALYQNHSFRIYGIIGVGYSLLINGGGGLSYTYEFGGEQSKTFMGLSIDTQFTSGVMFNGITPFTYNLFATLATGRHYSRGGRFTFDIIGAGFQLLNNEKELDFGIYSESVRENLVGVVINFLGFHHVASNGFHFSWRNNIAIYKYISSQYSINDVPFLNFSGNTLELEIRSYFTFGFDLSRVYNAKVYAPRSY